MLGSRRSRVPATGREDSFEVTAGPDGRLPAKTGRSSPITRRPKADGHELDSVKWPGYPSPATLSVMRLTDKPR